MNSTDTTLKILSKTENLKKVRAFVSEHAFRYGFDEETVQNITLAIDEACTNIIKHGYNYQKDREIELQITTTPTAFEVRIYNTGKKFNPDNVKPPDLRKFTEKHERGGFGLFLMKKLMDEVHFSFPPGKPNEVRLVKYR